MPTELELIALETEFDLYLTFTKRLVLNLPDSDDRTRAALWLQKLRSIDDDDHKKLRNEHLKLLLFALHRRSLLGVFEKAPPEELESFHDGLTLLEMTRELIELTEKKMASGDNSVDCPLPPVSTNISADLKEYGASQQIPKFGAHVYYAISNEPIQMWSKSANCVYPASSDVPNPLQWELTLSKLTDHVLEKQAEADRLAAEAEKGDKTEMIKDDDTHILPRIEVPAKEEAPFKWKADSILILHQNYDFSEVGAAEDLDEQGKLQLELDEMAFGILDHSLPGRQKVVIREPYYKGMPPDLPERRHHGVVEEISSSSSESLGGAAEIGFYGSTNSAQMRKDSGQSSSAAQSQDYGASFTNQYETSGSASQNFSAAMTKLGPLAQKYLSNETDFLYGLHFDKACNIFKVGNNYAFLEGDDILVNYGDDSNFDVELVRYNGTEGLWRLLTQNEDFNEEPPIYFTDADWVVFMDMLIATNRSPFNSMISTFCLFYWANGIFWGFPKELTTSSPPPQPEVGKPDQGYGVLGQMGDKVYQVIEEASKNPDHFWESLGCMDCVYLKEMDELIRMYAFRVRKVPDENSSFDNNCILFWIMERMFMLLARENGLEKVLSWLKINETLIVESGLLRTMARKLPWGLELSGTRPSKMQNDGDQREMFSKYVEVDENYINGQVIEGLNALDKIFQDTPDIFLEAKMIFTDISNDRLHLAFESALKFFRQCYSGC